MTPSASASRRWRHWVRWPVRAAALLVILVATTAPWWVPGVGHWLALAPSLAPADAIAVHGGNDNRPIYAIVLFRQGFAPELWLTGYAEREAANTALVAEQSMPPKQFHYLRTTNTWDDGRAIADFARERGMHHLLIVTEWWHSRRALCADRLHLAGADVRLSYTPPPDTPFGPDNWWRSRLGRSEVLSELVKFGYYWVRYGMVPWQC